MLSQWPVEYQKPLYRPMAGMVGAISGIFAFNYLKSKVDRDLELLEDKLPLNTD